MADASGDAAGESNAIGYVLKVFPRLSETFVINEIRELERQGVAVRVFSLHRPPDVVPHGVLRDLRADVTYVDSLAAATRGECARTTARLAEDVAVPPDLRERLLPRKYVRLALQLADAVRGRPVGALHAHFASRATHVAMLASRLLGIPYGFTAHAKDIYHHDVDWEVLRAEMRLARLVVTVSEFNRRRLLDIGAGLPGLEHRLRRLYNGVDLTVFRPDPETSAPVGRILAVGRLVEKKGFGVLAHACDILRREGVPFSCHLVGVGEEEPPLREMVAALALGAHVRFRGSLPLEAVAKEMKQATLVALPCVIARDGNVDALPTVLLEAMGCGLPVVSTSVSGIPEIVVHGETGLVVPPGDPVALAGALRAVLSDRPMATRMGAAGRLRAECLFDVRSNVARLRSWLAGPGVLEAAR